MEGAVDNQYIKVIPEHPLSDPGFKQASGHTEIMELTWLVQLFKHVLMVFLNIMEECGTHPGHLFNIQLDNPEECLDGIVRLIDQLIGLFMCPGLIIHDHLP